MKRIKKAKLTDKKAKKRKMEGKNALPFCQTTVTAEHERLGNEDFPCDDATT